METENDIVDAILEAQKPKEEQQSQPQSRPESASTSPFMKAVLIKKGEYMLPNSFVLPTLDLCLLGEEGTILVPAPNVLAVLGVGNKDIKCTRCGCVLAMKVNRPQIQDIAIKCPSCGTVNQL